jgi:hypothetical protein
MQYIQVGDEEWKMEETYVGMKTGSWEAMQWR